MGAPVVNCICNTTEEDAPCNLAPSEEDLLCDICRDGCVVVQFRVGEHMESVHVESGEVLQALRAMSEQL